MIDLFELELELNFAERNAIEPHELEAFRENR